MSTTEAPPQGLPYAPAPWSGLLSASLASSILALGLPVVVLQVYDRVLPNQAGSTLAVLATSLAVILLLDLGLRLLRADLIAWAAAQYEHQLGMQFSAKLLSSSIDQLDREGPGVQSGRLASIEAIKSFYCGTAASTIFDLPIVAISLLLVAVIGGWLIVVPLLLLSAFLLIGGYLGARLHHALDARSASDDRRLSFLIEMFSAVHTVKALAMEEQMLRRYERLFDGVDPLVYRAAQLTTMLRGISDVFAQATVIVVAACAAWLVVDGKLTLGEMAACTLLCGRTLQPALQSLGLWSQYQIVRVAKRRLLEGLALRSEPSGTMRLELNGELRLDHVVYRHPGAEQPIINGLSLHVAAGEILGVRGKDGSGKSTLVQLITGLIRPDTGEIWFDDLPLRDWDLRHLRRRIGVVSERSARFEGSLLDNLTLFQGEDLAIDHAELLQHLGIDDSVALLADGFGTRIGAGTGAAPEDLFQRIGIARVLMRQPRVLILDDANNSLDQSGDRRLIDLLNHVKGKMTIILISQRPSLLAIADRLMELDRGRLVPIADPADQPSIASPSGEAAAGNGGEAAASPKDVT